jgi:UDP-glucose 4-epimerase
MRILVTGGAGFIGSHVVDAYVGAGHDVTVLDDLSAGKTSNLNPGAWFVRGNILDPGLHEVFAREGFDVVSHHAARISVRESVEDPLLYANVNILGTLNVLEMSRLHGVRKVIFASSGGACYGDCDRPAREDDPTEPLSPYGESKLTAERYLRLYARLHDLDFTILRYGNVYGPRQDPLFVIAAASPMGNVYGPRQDPHGGAGLVALACGAILSGGPLRIFGDGRQERDYIHVDDVVRANLLALDAGSAETYNIGTGVGTSVNGLLALLEGISGSRIERLCLPAREGEVAWNVLDVGRAARHPFGWHPGTILADGLEDTIRHYRAG